MRNNKYAQHNLFCSLFGSILDGGADLVFANIINKLRILIG